MVTFGPLYPPASPALAVLSDALVVGAYALAFRLQGEAMVLRARLPQLWWTGHMRDALNLGAVLAMVGAVTTRGLPLPASILVGATSALVLHTARSVTWHRPGRSTTPAAVAVALALPPLFAPAQTMDALNRLAAALF